MSGEFRFETFVDVHSNIFNEYLSSVIAKLPKENEEYRCSTSQNRNFYEKNLKVFGVFDIGEISRSWPRKNVRLSLR